MQAVDPRTLDSGVSVWVKPAKFLVSVGVFALTAAWFFGYVRPERRERPADALARSRMLIVAGSFELALDRLAGRQRASNRISTTTRPSTSSCTR